MKRILIAGLCVTGITHFYSSAQTINYSFSQGSAAYQPLAGDTTLAGGSSWNMQGYKIPIGFSFNYMGKSFDTLTITSNGFILFGSDNERAIATFKGIMPVLDSNNRYSSISCLSAGNVLKIEYKNVGFGIIRPDNFNFQVWLSRQGNTVEFHTGSTTLIPFRDTLVRDTLVQDSLVQDTLILNSLVQDSLIMPIVGLINPSMSSGANNGYLLSGNPVQPSAQTLTADLTYIIRVPDPGTVYTFTPDP